MLTWGACRTSFPPRNDVDREIFVRVGQTSKSLTARHERRATLETGNYFCAVAGEIFYTLLPFQRCACAAGPRWRKGEGKINRTTRETTWRENSPEQRRIVDARVGMYRGYRYTPSATGNEIKKKKEEGFVREAGGGGKRRREKEGTEKRRVRRASETRGDVDKGAREGYDLAVRATGLKGASIRRRIRSVVKASAARCNFPRRLESRSRNGAAGKARAGRTNE